MIDTVAFIGFGLIGGSIARKLKKVHPSTTILAYSRTRRSLEQALEDGNIDRILDQLDASISDADLILLCTPVQYNAQYLKQIRPLLRPDCIVSDVGSTKAEIHRVVASLDMEECFIGGHPMAGSERTGYLCSKETLLENAYYVLTPTPKSTQAQISAMVSFVSDLSALPLVLDYKEHDYAVAAISHVPHVIAAGLVNLVASSDSQKEVMKQIAAGGFKDLTRIASSSPVMWEQICMTNKENIVSLVQDYIVLLQMVSNQIQSGDSAAIQDFFKQSGQYRNSISDSGNKTLNPEFAIYCDIPDKAGAISVLASILSFEEISIKNIGINHNRELQEGTIKIEFYKPEDSLRAAECLEYHHYTVFHRTE